MATVTDQYMLTTTDNPWNPYTHWDEWYAYDQAKGYDTPSLLARVSNFAIELTEAEQEKIIRDSIDEIIKFNILGRYKKIRKDDVIQV